MKNENGKTENVSRPIEQKYTPSMIERIEKSPASRCNCGIKDNIKCGCGGTVHLVEKFDSGRFTRNVCDGCGAMISSYGLHLLHVERCKVCGRPAVEDGLCGSDDCYNKMLEMTDDWDEEEETIIIREHCPDCGKLAMEEAVATTEPFSVKFSCLDGCDLAWDEMFKLDDDGIVQPKYLWK